MSIVDNIQQHTHRDVNTDGSQNGMNLVDQLTGSISQPVRQLMESNSGTSWLPDGDQLLQSLSQVGDSAQQALGGAADAAGRTAHNVQRTAGEAADFLTSPIRHAGAAVNEILTNPDPVQGFQNAAREMQPVNQGLEANRNRRTANGQPLAPWDGLNDGILRFLPR